MPRPRQHVPKTVEPRAKLGVDPRPKKLVKIWVLKYWATAGVFLQECEEHPVGTTSQGTLTGRNPDGKRFWYRHAQGNSLANGYHHRGSDFALTAEEARECVNKLAAKKRAQLTRQLAELDGKVKDALMVVEAVDRPLGGKKGTEHE